MWLKLRGALAAVAVLALLTSPAWAEDLQFYSKFASQEAEEADASCCDVGCDADCGNGCGDPCWSLCDSMYVLFAFDGWRNEADWRYSNNFGLRTGVNAGIPLLKSRGIGAQIGATVGFYDLSGRGGGLTTTIEDQTMITVGVFKRSDYSCGDRFSWALAYDHQFHNNYGAPGMDSLSIGQFRGLIGYALDCQNEIGFWMTLADDDDPLPAMGGLAGIWVEPVHQYNLFWRRYWECGGETMVYFGGVEDPGEFVIGLDGRVPLNSRWSLFCAAAYIKPSADAGIPGFMEEIWNVSAGLMFFPGCGAQSCCGPNPWAPLLPVADNGTFALDLDGGRGPVEE